MIPVYAGAVLPPIKHRDELAIATFFAQHLATNEGLLLEDLEHGNELSGEPDVVGWIGQIRHGVEVVGCWYSEDDAKVTTGLVRDLEQRGIRQTVWSSSGFAGEDLGHPSGDPYAAVMQRELDDHSRKQYAIPAWLILNGSQAPLHDGNDGPRLAAALVKPMTCRYRDVYICLSVSWTADRPRRFFRVP